MRRRSAWKAALAEAYMAIGQAERWAELCRTQLERPRRQPRGQFVPAASLHWAFAGLLDEARAAADGLIEAAIASDNPYMHTFATCRLCILPEFSRFRNVTLALCRQGVSARSRQRQSVQRSDSRDNSFWPRLESETVVTVAGGRPSEASYFGVGTTRGISGIWSAPSRRSVYSWIA